MNTYEPTPSQVQAFLESGYCHVVSVVDQMHNGVMRVYLRRGLSDGTHVRVSHADRVGHGARSDQLGGSGEATQISQQAKGARHV